jgi:phosphomannomutase
MSHLKASYPGYIISKNKIELTPDLDIDLILEGLKERYSKQPIITIDGVKIEFDTEWVHLRKSNTEPIIRIYAEGSTMSVADSLVNKIKSDIRELLA